MEKVIDLILEQKFFKPGSVVGVGVSGGSDSMALLHLLNQNKAKLDVDIIAIYVNHGLVAQEYEQALFVEEYCKQNHIRFHKFNVNALSLMHKGMAGEDACRQVRYGVFDSLRKRGIVDYVCLAHHERDQAETILMHILRGSGLRGASGMNYVRDDYYIRPLLDTPKDDILKYCYEHGIEYIEDETNADTNISRNLIRQVVMPELRKVWPNLDRTLSNFGKTCREDDLLIRKMMNFDAVLFENNVTKIPLTYFVYSDSLTFRLLNDCFEKMGITQDIERKHLMAIRDMAKKSENGSRIDLPNNIIVYKEYEYIAITKKVKSAITTLEYPFKVGTIKFGDYGKIVVKRVKSREIETGTLLIDLDKVPQEAVWRIRREGDFINKFGGGGIRKLKSYLNDKKVPARLKNYLPVLALNEEVFAVSCVDISESLRVTDDSKHLAQIKFEIQNCI